MATGIGGILGQAMLGALGGAAQAAGKNAEHEQKTLDRAKELETQEKVLRDRAVFLEKLKTDSATEKEETLRKLRARFYSDTAAAAGKETGVPYTDVLGSEEGAATTSIPVKTAPTRRELADFRLERAKLSGNASLAKEMYDESRDLRQEDEQRRKVTADERRSVVAERIAAVREQTAATGQARLEAMVAGLIGQGRARDKSDLPERKYDAKQWSDAKKELVGDLVIDDPIAGKSKPDHTARFWATTSMRRLQSAGDIDPADAAVLVGGISARVTAAAREAAKGDEARYKKFVVAGFQHELDKVFAKAGTGTDEPKPAGPDAAPTPKAATPQRREEPRLPGRQIFGPLTPESLIQSEAAAGNRDAIEYLKRRDAKKAEALEEQLRREQSGMHGEFQ